MHVYMCALMYLVVCILLWYLNSLIKRKNLNFEIFFLLFLLGADMDVCFSNYGHCNYVSAKHASIFYDEVNHIFSSKFLYYDNL